MDSIFSGLFIFVAGFSLGLTIGEISPKKETPESISSRVFDLISNGKLTEPFLFRDICDHLNVHEQRERQIVFEELNRLVDNATLGVEVKQKECRFYYPKVDLSA